MNFKRVLILVAMDVEFEAIQSLGFENEVAFSRPELGISALSFRHKTGIFFLAKSGVGLANAAITSAMLVTELNPTLVIMLGVAGALSEQLQIGDVVVASQIIQHDSVFSGEKGIELMAPGGLFLSIPAHERENPIFTTSAELLAFLRTRVFSATQIGIHEGLLLSGSEFVGSLDAKRNLAKRFSSALAVEMETASVALVTRRLGIPLLAIKTIADRLSPEHGVQHDYKLFLGKAAVHAGEVAKRILLESAA